jgi:hypothetical protein
MAILLPIRVPVAHAKAFSTNGMPPSGHIPDQRMVRSGSGTEIPCVFGTSGLMRIAAFELRSQEILLAKSMLPRHSQPEG